MDEYGFEKPTIAMALKKLGVAGWCIIGSPTTETEFAQNTRIFFSDGTETNEYAKFGVTWTQVKTEYDKIVSTYNSELYKRQRSVEYPDWGTQLDYIYHNGLDKWKTDIVDPVKSKYPKPS